jgi:hypothetical protein
MFARISTLAAVAAMTVAALAPATAAEARGYDGYRDGGYHRGDDDDDDRRRYYKERRYHGDRGYYTHRGYRDRGYYRPARDNRCDKGDGGTVIGAIAGGLLGHEVAGRGDRTLGTIIGAGVGAVAGRAIDRNC